MSNTCSGCRREVRWITPVSWPDGSPRGDFCVECRDWLCKGHRSSTVVMIRSTFRKIKDGSRRTRIYRNDTTGEFYEIIRTNMHSQAYFSAYGPANSAASLSDCEDPILMGEEALWGRDFSWSKAEKAFLKLLAKAS